MIYPLLYILILLLIFQVDVWCLGILCYELLVGSPPFESNNELVTKEKIRTLDYKFPSNMDALAKDLISKLVVPRKKRITLDDIMNHPFVVKNLCPKYFDPDDPRVACFKDDIESAGNVAELAGNDAESAGDE